MNKAIGSQLNVLHVITTLDMGGAENQLLLLVREQIKLGYKVRVVPLKGSNELEAKFLKCGASVDSDFINQGYLYQIRKLIKLVKQFDVVHAHLPKSELACALANPKVLIVSKHNCELFWPRGPRLLSRALSLLVQSRTNCFIAISHTVKKFLIANGEASSHKLSVVCYGYDATIACQPQSVEEAISGYPIIGTISRLVPQKDLWTLLRGFKQLTMTFPKAVLVVIGDGPLNSKLKNYSNELEIFQNIVWLGRRNNVLDYLGKLDVFVMSSLYEGFGLVLLEAMSKEVPVIASRNDAFCEILGDSSTQLFPIGDYQSLYLSIIATLDSEKRSQVLQNQKQILLRYSSQSMIRDMERVYLKVLH